MNTLSGRQRELLIELVKGKSNKEIALVMNITEGTVKMKLHILYTKYHVANRTQLAIKFKEEMNEKVPVQTPLVSTVPHG